MIFFPMQIKANDYEYLELNDDGSITLSPQNANNLIEYVNELEEYKLKYENLKETDDKLLQLKDEKISLLKNKITNLEDRIELKDEKINNKNEEIKALKRENTKDKIKYIGSGAAIVGILSLIVN